MVLKLQFRAAVAAACMTLAMGWSAAQGQEIPMVNGKHWTESSEQTKKAYLLGIANASQVEIAYQAGNSTAEAQSVMSRLAKGLKGQTLDTVRQGLDRWYAANPGQLQRPVIETIWFEMVAPGLKNTK